MSLSARVKGKTDRPLLPHQLETLRHVFDYSGRNHGGLHLGVRQSAPLRARRLVYATERCAPNGCAYYRVTPKGYRWLGLPVPENWRTGG